MKNFKDEEKANNIESEKITQQIKYTESIWS